MKKIYQVILGLILFTSLTIAASAHPGNTDSSGCHTCRTNCSSWGLSTGEYHCHNAKALPQPEAPIRSHYGSGGTGTTEYWPEYESSYSSYTPTPSCPLHSTYSYLNEQCKCNSGYYAKGNSCVSLDTSCQDDLGYNSKYNSFRDTCECSYGYVIDGGRCQDADYVCHKKFGYGSSYDSLSNTCECDYGYEMSNGQCVREQQEYVPSPVRTPSVYQDNNTRITPPITTPIVVKNVPGFKYDTNLLKEYPSALSYTVKQGSNVRSCPVKTCSLITYIEPETKILVTAEYGNWRKIKIQDKEGWVFKDLITIDEIQVAATNSSNTPTVTKSGFFKKIFNWIK
jgi:hypothetical protein